MTPLLGQFVVVPLPMDFSIRSIYGSLSYLAPLRGQIVGYDAAAEIRRWLNHPGGSGLPAMSLDEILILLTAHVHPAVQGSRSVRHPAGLTVEQTLLHIVAVLRDLQLV